MTSKADAVTAVILLGPTLHGAFPGNLRHRLFPPDARPMPAALANEAWKQRQRKLQVITSADGEKPVVMAERVGYRQCVTPVRAHYLDLPQWAIEDPGRWAQWAAPRPVGQKEISRFRRHRKARMDARTRERLPPSKSCGSPAAGSKNYWRSATTA